jgi:SAM-dependent methyltransferase
MAGRCWRLSAGLSDGSRPSKNMFPLLYHTHHSLHMEDLPFWLELAGQHPGGILELGCGTGRVLLPLLQAGHWVFGLDNDLEMLRFLRGSLPSRRQGKAPVFLADMAHFHLAREFPLILLPCNTWSTLPPKKRQAALGCIRAHLAGGGVFALSLPNPAALAELPRRGEEEVEETFTHPHSGCPVQVSSAWRRSKGHFTVLWHYDHLLPDGQVKRLTAQVQHSLEQPKVYIWELEQAGLQIGAVYGDFDRSPYTAESPALILVAAAPK